MKFSGVPLRLTTSMIIAGLVLVAPQTSTAANAWASQSPERAVVVIEGGGSTHPFTTPSSACGGGRPQYVQALVDAGLPTFTAPGYTNSAGSTSGRTGCPPQPPVELQWNTAAFPTQAGESVLGFLGFLNATYGYTTFDLVGYSYGGVVARATVAAMKRQPAEATLAPAFSYAAEAVKAGVEIASITTLNSPHLGSPAYDIAADPRAFVKPVALAWGQTFADHSKSLLVFQRADGAGAIQFLQTSAHAKRNPKSWDAQQVGVLDGIPLTLIAGDYSPESCRKNRPIKNCDPVKGPRTDGTVPVYSQLLLPCPKVCPTPPGSVYLPPGLLPETNVVRKTFPTVHSTFDANGYGVPEILSVSKNPAAIAYLVATVTDKWQKDGVAVQP
jgi:triacylglycerol lipase